MQKKKNSKKMENSRLNHKMKKADLENKILKTQARGGFLATGELY